MNIETIIKSEKKKYKIVFLVCIIVTIIGIPLLMLSSSISDNDKKNASHFKKELNKLTYIEPVDISKPFYYHDDKEQSYRFVEDKSGDVYVINVYESRVSDIKRFDSKIYGKGRKLDEKKIKYLTEQFNRTYENVTEEKVREIYGVYFDATSYDSIGVVVLIFFGVLFVILAPFMFFLYLCVFISFKKSIKHLNKERIDDVNKELNGNVKSFDKLDIILTDNYIISHNSKLLCFKYSEIFMIYVRTASNKGGTIHNLCAVVNNGKQYALSTLHQFSKGSKSDFFDIIDVVADKNPEVLIGDTAENNKLLKEFKKELKRNKKNKITN